MNRKNEDLMRLFQNYHQFGLKAVKLGLLVSAFFLIQTAAQAQTPMEQQCFDMVQGKVAWDKAGSTSWQEGNLRSLCAGTTNPQGTIDCFKTKIAAGITYGPAIQACSKDIPNTSFYMVFVGDPQYPRVGDDVETKAAESEKLNRNQVSSIKKLVQELGSDKVKGLIINGDLTEYGGASELSMFKTIWMSGGLPNVYLGLGNHDYSNNLGTCFPSTMCSDRMIGYFANAKAGYGVPIKSFDWNANTRSGSLAYSWDVGNIHFIQLNNYPAFTAISGEYTITPSIDWLEKDMSKARREGKAIIVNMHDTVDTFKKKHPPVHQLFIDMLSKYQVSAVFSAHIHAQTGRVADNDGFGAIPSFRTGAPMYGTYLYVSFTSNTLTVEGIEDTTGGTTRNPKPAETFDLHTPVLNVPPTDRSQRATYTVKVKTSDVAGAGTDANVYISFFGSKGQSSEYHLSNGKNNFEKGDSEEFTLNGVEDVGDLQGFNIRSDLTNLRPGWFLQSVDITKGGITKTQQVDRVLIDNDNKSLTFIFGNRNNVGDRGDELSKLNAEAGDYSTVAKATTTILNDAGTVAKSAGNEIVSGSTAAVNATIDGTKEAGKTTATFLGAKDVKTNNAAAKAPRTYQIKIKTKDESGAGTDSSIYLNIYGTQGQTGNKQLNSLISGNAFGAGGTDSLSLTAEDVGTMTKISVESSLSGFGAGWLPEYMEITSNGETKTFRMNNWIDSDRPKATYQADPAPVVAATTTAKLNGNWIGYLPDATKSSYVWAINQTGTTLAFRDVGGTNATFSGRISGNTITDSNNKTGTLSADGLKITWSDGVIWRLRYPNLAGAWVGYFKNGNKSVYIWAISQTALSLTFQDVGTPNSNLKFTGRIEGETITDGKKTATLSADGKIITWSDGVTWRKQ